MQQTEPFVWAYNRTFGYKHLNLTAIHSHYMNMYMRRIRKPVTYGILFVLLTLVFKVFFADITAHGSANEFAHVHLVHISDSNSYAAISSPQSKKKHNDDNCHGGMDLFICTLPDKEMSFLNPDFKLSFEKILKIENGFISPNLEPNRKPPKQQV